MMNHKDFYALGLPIDTEIGSAHFLKVKDYPDYIMDLQNIGMSKLEVIHRYKEAFKDGSADDLIEEMDGMDLYEISIGLPELRHSYYKVFASVFNNNDILSHLDKDSFDFYRKLIMDMNCVKEEQINPNPEIQRAIERSKRVKSQDQDKLTFGDMCSSIVVHSGISYEALNEFTIFQLYLTFHRIAQFKNYDTSTLFATVSEKAKVESWSKHIDLYEEEKHFVTEDQFSKNTGSMFND